MISFFNTTQAAKEWGVKRCQAAWICRTGKVRAEKMGRDWLISSSEVKRYQEERLKPGQHPYRNNHAYDKHRVLR